MNGLGTHIYVHNYALFRMSDKLTQMVRIGIGVGMIGLGLQGSGYVQLTYKLEYSVKRCGRADRKSSL